MAKQLSGVDVKYEIDNLRANLFLEEKEDTWEKIGRSITSLIKICENGGYDTNPTELVTILRSAHRPIISAMNSERTRLCLIPLELLSTIVSVMGGDFEELLPLYMQPLLSLCARTNKVIITRARTCIFFVIEYTQSAALLSYFLQNIKDKSNTLKLVVVEGTLACLNSCNPPDIEKESRVVEIESIIRVSARDASADVRKISRKMFESYQILFPSRVSQFTAPLSPTTRKYLDIKASTVVAKPMPTMKSTTTRPKTEMKPTTTTAKASSSRATSSTLSTSTLNNQPRAAAPTMTRVTRKELTVVSSKSSGSYAPVRPVQTTKSYSDSQRTTTQRSIVASTSGTGPIRVAPTQEQKRPIPPLRSQSVAASRVAGTSSSILPNRFQLNSANPTTTASGAQPVPSGPRRVPMPDPAPAPTVPKEKEGPKRPASRVDNATSTRQRPVNPSAPITRKPTAVALSSKDRAPPTSTQAKSRSTASSAPVASASSTTTTTGAGSSTIARPTVVPKPKAQWGRSAPAPKILPGASQKSTATASQKPAPIASQKATSSVAQKAALISSKAISGAQPKVATSTVRKGAPVATQNAAATTSQRGAGATSALVRKPSSRVLPKAAPSKKRPVTPAMVALPPSPTPEEDAPVVEENAGKENEVAEHIEPQHVQEEEQRVEEHVEEVAQPSKPSSLSSTPDLEEENVATQTEVSVVDSVLTTPASAQEHIVNPPIDTPPIEEFEEVEHSPVSTSANCIPQTPQGLFPIPSGRPSISSKTPISALLSSIEQGFAFSPITPLSPADLYLNPNNTTPYTHQTHAAPRQPFNYALHAPNANGMFSGFAFADVKRREEDMVRGDIGVIKVSDHDKLFTQMGLDDAMSRQAFVELNQ